MTDGHAVRARSFLLAWAVGTWAVLRAVREWEAEKETRPCLCSLRGC